MKIKYSRKSVAFFSITFIWMVVIFIFSAQNGDESSDTSGFLLGLLCDIFRIEPSPEDASMMSFLIRKAAHMTEFGVLALLWLGTLRSGLRKALWNYPAAFALSSFYAATDEIHQLFVSDRAGQVTDWLIDSAGATVFLICAWIFSRTCAGTADNRNDA
ncbi:MAG: VanZ family protein [Clostridia bacterium]|nr:VanZ family protein [Clostridia bacterium]